MGNSYITNPTVIEIYGLDSSKGFDEQFSKVSIESILFYIVAASIWVLENMFSLHKQEVDNMLSERTPHTLRWYRNMALAYRYGHDLIKGADQFTEEAKADSTAAVITYAAVTRGAGELVMKVAKGGSELSKLSDKEYEGFREYMLRLADAGVRVNIVSVDADRLKLVVDVHYNPMVLDADGKRLDGSSDTPIQDAITTYLQNLPFDGEFTLTALTDALQVVEGVDVPRIISAETRWGAYNWAEVRSKYRAEAGWLKIYDPENDLSIIYHANISE